MRISIIAAVAENGVIGNEGKLPWHIPEDLKFFKKVTMGKPVIMGRKTWETLLKPLPGRENIIVTSKRDFEANGAVVVHSIQSALEAANGADEVMILGGAEIYKQTLSLANRMYLTHVHQEFTGDTYFPEYDPSEWQEVKRTESVKSDDNLRYSFVVYDRVKG